MEHLANIPITILVKAPNQKTGDQRVECFMDWTVRRLKSHLAAVYPNKPTEKGQRIIYSGKLLQDHSVLKDVFRAIDSDTLHIVHLVYTPMPGELAESDTSSVSCNKTSNLPNQTPNRKEDSNNQNSNSRTTNVEEPSDSGIRQRHAARHYSNGTTGNSTGSPSNTGSPSAYQNMSPQQLQWMQHIYMQQMAVAYYMQYHAGSNQSFLPGPSPPWTPPATYPFPEPVVEQPPIANFNAPGNEPGPLLDNNNGLPRVAAANVQPPRNVPRVQNQQMNAGVGPAVNEDEEEAANRDWLDWIYTLCRFGVLLSIVYFYSSMNRFLLVAGIMFLVYLYEHNFFRLLRRGPVARIQVEEQVDPPVENREEEAAEVVEDDHPDVSGNDDSNDTTSPSTDEANSSPNSDSQQTSDETVEELPRAESNETPKPGFFLTFWIFITTFFTSLIPRGPQQVNVN